MKVIGWRRYLGLMCLLLLVGCNAGVEAGAVSPAGSQLKTGAVEQFVPETGNWMMAGAAIVLETASNEAESVVLRVNGIQGKAFQLNFSPLGTSGITLRWYQVMQADGGGGLMDALAEPDGGGMVYPTHANSQFLLKAIVPAGTATGTYRWNMLAIVNGQTIHSGELKLIVHPVTLDLPTINLQGNLLFKRDDVPDEVMLALLGTMHSYGFTGLVLPKTLFKKVTLGSVEQYALDNFQYIRMSPRILFTRKKTLTDSLLAEGLSKEQWLQDECHHVAQILARMKADARPHNVFAYKLWDEPMPENYAEVAYSYGGLKKCVSTIPLELTEPPSARLGDIADIWTVNINSLNSNVVKQVRQQNDRIYLYANYLHEITDNPLAIRNIGWLMGYFGLDGYHFWSVANWGNGALEQNGSETGREERGTLFYWDGQTNRVLPSLRMEMFREGLDDMQLLGLVKACAVSGHAGGVKAAQVLGGVDAAIKQWDFNDPKSRVPVLATYRSALLGAASDCRIVSATRPLRTVK